MGLLQNSLLEIGTGGSSVGALRPRHYPLRLAVTWAGIDTRAIAKIIVLMETPSATDGVSGGSNGSSGVEVTWRVIQNTNTAPSNTARAVNFVVAEKLHSRNVLAIPRAPQLHKTMPRLYVASTDNTGNI
jgi:hypothetical protein